MVYGVETRGMISENAYFLLDEGGKHGFLVDPGSQGEALYRLSKERGWNIEAILLTHGHFDHIGGVEGFLLAMQKEEGKTIPIYAHKTGEKYLTDPYWNLSEGFGREIRIGSSVTYLEEGGQARTVEGDLAVRLIHTPGHTEDSCLWYEEKMGVCFVGDTIFADGGYGNDRFPGGNGTVLFRSIREKVLTLPEDTILYSGHSRPTKVADEKAFY